MLKTVEQWKYRNLTLAGKIVIAKSLLLPQVTHILSSLPDPDPSTVKEINDILFTFIWGSKRNPIKEKDCAKP